MNASPQPSEKRDSLEETLDVVASATLVTDIREALADLEINGADVLTKDQALDLITRSDL